MSNALGSIVHLSRPLNVALPFASVILGYWLAVSSVDTMAFLAALSAALISAAGYIHNDIVDLDVDRVSHPDRPLPSGRVTNGTAALVTTLLAVVGIASTTRLPPECFEVALLIVVTLVVYNHWLKLLPLVGNVAVGLVGGAPFVFGGLAAQHAEGAILPGAMASAFHFVREVLKDVQDLDGDCTRGSRTLPLLLGLPASRVVVAILLVSLIGLIPAPALLGWVGPIYLLLGLILCTLLLLVCCLVLQAKQPSDFAIPSDLLKAGMVVGLLAFALDVV